MKIPDWFEVSVKLKGKLTEKDTERITKQLHKEAKEILKDRDKKFNLEKKE